MSNSCLLCLVGRGCLKEGDDYKGYQEEEDDVTGQLHIELQEEIKCLYDKLIFFQSFLFLPCQDTPRHLLSREEALHRL